MDLQNEGTVFAAVLYGNDIHALTQLIESCTRGGQVSAWLAHSQEHHFDASYSTTLSDHHLLTFFSLFLVLFRFNIFKFLL